MHNLTQSQAQARCNSTFSPLADAVQSCIQVSQFAQGHYCPSGKRIMLPWKLINILFFIKRLSEGSGRDQREAGLPTRNQFERPSIFCKSSVFILYDISHRPQLSTTLVPILLVQFFACLTYLYFGGKYHYCNFFMPLAGNVQFIAVSQQTVAAWRHLAASGYPTPSRRCATTTVTALHCLFVCLFGSFVYCLTELFLLGISLKIILLAALFCFSGFLRYSRSLQVPLRCCSLCLCS